MDDNGTDTIDDDGTDTIMNYSRSVKEYTWVIFILSMLGFLLYLLIDLYTNYMRYGTVTKINVQMESVLMFPAVTICNLSPYTSKYVNVTPALQNFLLMSSPSLGRYAREINWTHPEYKQLEDEDLAEWHDMASVRQEDTFAYCTVNSIDVNCTDYFTTTETDIGRCFTFNKNGSYKTYVSGSKSGLGVKINVHQNDYIFSSVTSAGIKVFVHSPGQEPRVHEEGTLIATGTETYIQVLRKKFSSQPYPYKSSGNRYCIDTEAAGFVNPLKYYPVYSQFGCFFECMYTPLYQKCGCAPPAQAERWNVTVCNRRRLLECIKAGMPDTESKMKVFASCDCGKPCLEFQYDTVTSSASAPSDVVAEYLRNLSIIPNVDYARQNLVELHVFFKAMTTEEIIYEPEYTIESIAVSLGGFMGLFLGCSLLTLLEIIEFMFTAVFKMVSRKRHFKHPPDQVGQSPD